MAKRLLDEVSSDRLRIIFDPINLLPPNGVNNQDDLWQRCIDCFGDKVIAMHIKNGCWQDSQYIPLPLDQGVMHFQPILRWIREKMPDLPLIREEAQMRDVKKDIAFIKAAWKA